MTIEEFARAPLEGVWELVDGTPIELSYASGQAGSVSGKLLARLLHHAESNKTGWVFPANTGFVLFDDRQTVRSPDVSVVLRTRLPELTDEFVPVAPDLAAEVLSPWDRITDVLAKIAMYLEAGVRLVWLVDPASESVAVFRPEVMPATLNSAHVLDGDDVLPGFSVPVSEIFA